MPAQFCETSREEEGGSQNPEPVFGIGVFERRCREEEVAPPRCPADLLGGSDPAERLIEGYSAGP